jgi:hypothetical protein
LTEAAEKEAARIMDQAKIERDRLLSENEILKVAKAEAERIRAEADAEAAKVKRGADEYAMDLLVRMEGVASKALASIERGKQELGRGSAARPKLPPGA